MRRTVFALVLAIPTLAHAAFVDVYTTADPLLEIGVAIEIPIFFDTDDTVLPGGLNANVFGWGLVLQGTGDLALLSFSGPFVDSLSTCLDVDGSQQHCAFIDDGSPSASGFGGIAIPLGTLTVLAQGPDDVLYLSTADFTEGNFSTTSRGGLILAGVSSDPQLPQPTPDFIPEVTDPIPSSSEPSGSPVPEPGAALLFLTGMGVVALRLRAR